MHITFYHYDKPFEVPFIEDFTEGLKDYVDTTIDTCHVDDFKKVPKHSDIAAFVGIRGRTREIVDAYRDLGKRVIVFDKGVIRFRNISSHRRVNLDGGTCLAYLNRVKIRPADRWKSLNISLAPMQHGEPGAPIIYANNSQKVHDYWGLGSAEELAEDTVRKLMHMAPKRKIVFSPKPRALDFREIEGAILSLKPNTIEDALAGKIPGVDGKRAHCLVTHTSSCSINALIAGVPVVVLSPNPAKSVAGKYIEQALQPPLPTDEERLRLLQNLAWCQWTAAEFRNGEMWRFLKREIAATLPQKDEPIAPLRKEDENEGVRNDPGEVGVKGPTT